MAPPPALVAGQTARSVLKMLRPHRMAGQAKVRLGRLFDGGYVMLDKFDGVAAAYSLGVNDDVSWDRDIAARGIPVFQYDHTIDRLPQEHALFHWEKIGIGPAPDPIERLETLPNLIHRNGHESVGDMVLKCDIEGAEWSVLRDIPHGVLQRFTQIVIELHGLSEWHDLEVPNNARGAVLNLVASHKVVHVHANNFSPWAVVGGVAIPDVIEVTLARVDQGRFEVSDESFPTPIDLPNNPNFADLYLGRFAFD